MHRPSVEELEPRVLLASNSLLIPTEAAPQGAVEIQNVERRAAFRNELGVFAVDDATGRVGGLRPGQQGYAKAALRNARRLFDGRQGPGEKAVLPFAPGTRVGFYLIQDGTLAGWRRRNARNEVGKGPLALFSFSAANPERFNHCRMTVEDGRVSLAWEDVFGGDNDFNDVVATIAIAGRPSPALQAALRSLPVDAPPTADSRERITLVEEDRFRTSAEKTITVPAGASVLSFDLSAAFDTTDPDGVNDVFEAALLDDNGLSLIHTLNGDTDAFLNLTEGQPAALGAGTTFDGQTVTVNLAGLPAGSTARAVLRLVNNDRDITTRAEVIDLKAQPGGDGVQPSAVPAVAPLRAALAVDFTALTDVSAGFVAEYARTTFHDDTQELTAAFALRNGGLDAVGGPLVVAVANLSDPAVRVRGADGVTPDGLPYYLLSGAIAPGATSGSGLLTFYNPGRTPFTYDLVILGVPNRAPVFTSQPDTEALLGQEYRTDADAVDPDGDAVTYSLVSGPAGMVIDRATGVITWTPTEADLGSVAVTVEADDGRGGVTRQAFAVIVDTGVPNRPPVITSMPVTDGNVLTPYAYAMAARDEGNDSLTFALTTAPAGMVIDPTTGVIAWTPTAAQLGDNTVTVSVSDGRGGVGTQTFAVTVAAQPGNAPPVILSEPVTTHLLPPGGTVIEYQDPLESIDPDSDAVSYRLVEGPAGMRVEGDTVVWSPTAAQVGTHPVTVEASDGRGGTDTQSFVLAVTQSLTPLGSISGTLFDDADGDRIRDPGETALEQWTVYLDTDGDGVRDHFEPTAVTAADGSYRFDGLPAGRYTVREVLEPGWLQTAPGGEGGSPGGTVHYVDWTSANPAAGTASGVIRLPGGSTVTVGFRAVNSNGSAGTLLGAQTDGSGTDYWINAPGFPSPYVSAEVPNRPPGTDILQLVGGVNQTYRVTLSEPILDPIMAILSLGNSSQPTTYNFDSPFTIVSRGKGYWGGDATTLQQLPGNVLRGNEGHGTLKFLGTFDTFSWTVPTPEFWHGFTFAVRTSESLQRDGFYVVDLSAGEIESGKDFGNRRLPDDPGNEPPAFASTPPATATIGRRFRYDVAVTDADPFDQHTFDLVVRPLGMGIDPNRGIVVWTPSPDQLGEHDAILRVRDGNGGVALQQFRVTVGLPNTAPVITSTPDGPATVGNPFVYTIRAQDAENDPLTFALVAGPVGMAVDTTTGLLTWTPAALGDNPVTVAVRDTNGAETHQTFTLTVSDVANRNPTITSSPRTVVGIGQPYLYLVRATDSDGDPLTLTLDPAPAGMTLDPVTRALNWTPDGTQLGTHTVRLLVSDGRGGEAVQEFTVEVVPSPVNGAPSIISAPPLAATAGKPLVYDPVAEDPDRDPVFWSLVEGPAGMSVDPVFGFLRWTPGVDQSGPHTVTLTATDPFGETATQTFTIRVRGANAAPWFTSTPPTRAGTDRLFNYTPTALDPDGDALTYSLTQSLAGMTIDPTAGRIDWTPTTVQIGSHEIVVAATDGSGGTAIQVFTVVVSDRVSRPPVITSTPDTTAAVGFPYEYQLAANDPDGGALAFALDAAPAGMFIDPLGGLIVWDPIAGQAGQHAVRVRVSDADGGEAVQSFTLDVRASNQFPVLDGTPQQFVAAGEAYRVVLPVSDPDGDPLTFTLVSGPAGMTLDTAGRVTWQTTLADVGVHGVAILIADDRGAEVELSYQIRVATDTAAPRVAVQASQNPIDLSDAVIVQVYAVDDIGVSQLVLTAGGVAVPLDMAGRATLRPTAAGPLELVATARDAAGNVSSASTTLFVRDPADVNAPVATLAAPAEGATLTTFTNVVGTVTDDNLAFYTLSLAPVGGAFTEFARGTDPVTDGVLGRLDPTLLENGSYILRLQAADLGGNVTTTEREVSLSGNLKLGNFRLTFTDLSVPVSGIPVVVARTYDTLAANQSGDLGYGWKLEVRDTDLRTSVAKTGLEEDGIFNPFQDRSRVTITLPDGTRQGFTFVPRVRFSFFGLTLYRPEFVPDPGVTSTLTVAPYDIIRMSDGTYSAFGLPYNPADSSLGGDYTLTTQEGLRYRIDGMTGDLETVTDRNGNTVTFAANGVTSSTGVGVTFGRDPRGRITSVTDPLGNAVRYGYDVNGDLTSVTDREGNVSRLIYRADRPHFLDSVTDPLGRTGGRAEYDEQGRLSRATDAEGRPTEITYDLDNSVNTVRDALGKPTTYRYDERGNVVEEADALGGVTRRTYDANNNLLSETDALNHTTTFAYDAAGNVVRKTDPLGNVTRTTFVTVKLGGFQGGPSIHLPATVTDSLGDTVALSYDNNGNLTRRSDALGRITTTAYDARGNVTEEKAGDGGITRHTYDAAGNRLSTTDPLGHATRYAYDAAGNPISVTDALGNVTEQTFDANGLPHEVKQTRTLADGSRQVLTTRYESDPTGMPSTTENSLGQVTSVSFNAEGRPESFTDASGDVTRQEYDALGRLLGTTHPDGSEDRYGYDALGRRTSWTDAEGNTTRYEYDAVGRPTRTVHPDGTFTATTYDALGRKLTETDERGGVTRYAYELRRETVTDPLGNVTVREYDGDGPLTPGGVHGNLVRITDPRGNTTRFVYDLSTDRHGHGWLIQTIQPDGRSASIGYDAAGRRTSETDTAGHTTAFAYDALDRMTEVTDALGGRTAFTYDEVGNRTSITDANGHTTRFEYDALGRVTKRLLPLGQAATFTYDVDGHLVSQTNFNGDTTAFAYDDRHRLIRQTESDGSSVVFTYTPTGQRQTVTDARGTTTYAYDARDRLISRTEPDGRELRYTYDAAGNVATMTTPSGTTQYEYDALNRIETVTDARIGTTRYTYDAAGNVIRTDRPNGTTEVQTYDAMNRLLSLTHTGPGGVIASYLYTYDAAGNRASVREQDGRLVSYAYDALSRLVRETVDEPGAGDRTTDYTYDAAGNRLTRNDSADSLTTYEYDDNDRLLVERAGAAPTSYTYDDNGNVLSRTGGGADAIAYTWDANNRLRSAVVTGVATSHVEYQYDADGLRVASVVDGVETRYLLDTNRPHAQVVEEYTPAGVVNVSYVYGSQLLAENRAGATTFYHADGLGSTRALTDGSGATTERHDYDAFGRSLDALGGAGPRYLFAGEPFDVVLGSYYLRARHYDPATGRFQSMDPFGGFGERPLSMHKYLYAEADPVNRWDPSGRTSSLVEASAVLLVAAVLFDVAVVGLRHNAIPYLDSSSLSLTQQVGIRRDLAVAQAAAFRQMVDEGTGNYRKWFGEPNLARELYVASAWQQIWLASIDPSLTFRRREHQTEFGPAIAHVYPFDGTLRVFLGDSYWNLPDIGSEKVLTRSMVLIHELSHEVRMAWDIRYEYFNSRDLAESHPWQAIRNADNYGYASTGR